MRPYYRKIRCECGLTEQPQETRRMSIFRLYFKGFFRMYMYKQTKHISRQNVKEHVQNKSRLACLKNANKKRFVLIDFT